MLKNRVFEIFERFEIKLASLDDLSGEI